MPTFRLVHIIYINKKMLLWLLTTFLLLTEYQCLAAFPTLDDITNVICPPLRPFKCLPYGMCYNADMFCYAGALESCFPKTVTEDTAFTWCRDHGQHDVSLMRDYSCSLACQARFPNLDLSKALHKLINLQCPHDQPLKCIPDGQCFGYDEFCDHGKVTSCFPSAIPETELLDWCKHTAMKNISLMAHPSCALACQKKFTLQQLTDDSDNSWKSAGTVLIVIVVLAALLLVCSFAGFSRSMLKKRLKKLLSWNSKKYRKPAGSGKSKVGSRQPSLSAVDEASEVVNVRVQNNLDAARQSHGTRLLPRSNSVS
ncbi:uncharacterized protein LOC131938528 [Physella acuta]|uniref:uncharacterized protein LOC131938528 n=1 Tax=Physella acuta TaxID=109671 RepID=UPI0027DC4F83|nr:uncharacterized protein LOC131938528 [Physella acuta]